MAGQLQQLADERSDNQATWEPATTCKDVVKIASRPETIMLQQVLPQHGKQKMIFVKQFKSTCVETQSKF